MILEQTDSPVIVKTKELCQTLLEQSTFKDIRQKIETFSADEGARAQYSRLCDLQEMLQAKDEQGLEITDGELADFETQREAFLENSVARGFMDAQESLHKLQETIAGYVSKTFKLGRMPTEDDFEKGACGPTCGCGGH